MRTTLFALVLAFSLAGFGCNTPSTGTPADDSGTEVDDPATKADGASKPLGTFIGKGAISGSAQLDKLVLESNGNCFLEVEPCGHGSCTAEPYYCSYRFTRSGSTHYIHLDQPAADVPGGIVRFAYSVESDGALALLPPGTIRSVTLDRLADHQWCTAVDDCALQAYSCNENWACSSSGTCDCSSGPPNACVSGYGKCVTPDTGDCATGKVSAIEGCGVDENHIGLECCLPNAANACEVAGGACVAQSPGSCSGVVGDATKYSCGLGAECCLPHAPAAGDTCRAAGGTCVPKSSEGDLCDIFEADDCGPTHCCL